MPRRGLNPKSQQACGRPQTDAVDHMATTIGSYVSIVGVRRLIQCLMPQEIGRRRKIPELAR